MLNQVNILQGTASSMELSYGNTLPLVAWPFGFVHWTLQTSESPWLFHPDAPKLQGIRATRQPSPWIGDYGAITLLPQVGTLATSPGARSSSYRASALQPDLIELRLLRYDAGFRLTPTAYGACIEVTFPSGPASRRILIEPAHGMSCVAGDASSRRVAGWTSGNSGNVPAGFASHWIAEFDQSIERFVGFAGEHVGEAVQRIEHQADRAGIAVEFAPATTKVTIRIAFSLISQEMASAALARDLSASRSFADLQSSAARAWEGELSHIEIEEPSAERRRTFYSCLYRCFLFPRAAHEIDADGSMVHWSPYDGRVHPGPHYTDNGFWDTHRTVYPLLCLLDRPRVGQMVEGFLNAYKQGGWLPQWASPGYRACMIGTHSDAVLAHAAACGVSFDLELAYEAAAKNAFVASNDLRFGRAGLQDYIDRGYVPLGSASHSVSATLDYAYDDWCVAQLALRTGRRDQAQTLLERASQYRHVFDPGVGFMRARNADGSWGAFDEFEWGGPYVEGGAWQCSWAVNHDPAGLIELHGGNEAFVAKLEQMLELPPTFRAGEYRSEIHEMTEMALANFGQYAHSNQPVHHALYLFAAAGRADLTRKWVRRVMAELYHDGPKGLPGDEDNGEMSAWYVFNAIGLYPLCPGDGRYWFGSPAVRGAVIRPADGPPIEIHAPNAGAETPAVVRAESNDHWIDFDQLRNAKVLRFQ